MRRPSLDQLERDHFDVIVIGGGINGCGIARDAALRGLRVLLLEKGDLGSGTTSWSSRLIHGGLRYLEHGEVGLVRESLRERELLLRNAPHLVKPLPFLAPLYRHNRRRPLTIRAGMAAYDLLSVGKSLPRHRMLDAAEARRRVPGLDAADLRGAAFYFDAQATFPERLAVENGLSAHDHGATILTHAKVDGMQVVGDRVTGVTAIDLLTDMRFQVEADAVINVTGPWVDQLLAGLPSPSPTLIGGTKGSHIVVDPFPGAPAIALYYEARADGRAVLVIPWNNRYLIGATDLRYDGDPDRVAPDEDEIAYLLRETNHLIPAARLARDAVLYAYSGIRPLPHQPAGPESAITRRHLIHDHAPDARGLLSVVGGKLTTYRELAEQVVDHVVTLLGGPFRPCRTAELPLPGAAGVAFELFASRFVDESGLADRVAQRLLDVYGARAADVLALTNENSSLSEVIDPASGLIAAEIVWAVHHEAAATLADILLRRTMVGLDANVGMGADSAATRVAQRQLGWSDERADREIAAYRAEIARFYPRRAGPAPARPTVLTAS